MVRSDEVPGTFSDSNESTEVEKVERPRDEARKAYNRMSRIYDMLTSGAEEGLKEEGISTLNPLEEEKILEIGCGTGGSLIDIARAVRDNGHVYGIDISEGMLEVARKKIDAAKLSDRVTITRGDAIELPYEESFFDAVFMSFTLELFSDDDIPSILEECRRVLKDGGRICVVGVSNRGKNTMMKRAYVWFHLRFPRYVDCRPIFIEQTLSKNSFKIVKSDLKSLYGLPVEIILARK